MHRTQASIVGAISWPESDLKHCHQECDRRSAHDASVLRGQRARTGFGLHKLTPRSLTIRFCSVHYALHQGLFVFCTSMVMDLKPKFRPNEKHMRSIVKAVCRNLPGFLCNFIQEVVPIKPVTLQSKEPIPLLDVAAAHGNCSSCTKKHFKRTVARRRKE